MVLDYFFSLCRNSRNKRISVPAVADRMAQRTPLVEQYDGRLDCGSIVVPSLDFIGVGMELLGCSRSSILKVDNKP